MKAPSVPNTGRMVDYWLGGSHYFPIDVEAAKLFEDAYPNFQVFFKKLRDFNGRASRYIESQGINRFIVFAAGVPTCGNVSQYFLCTNFPGRIKHIAMSPKTGK